MVRTFDKGNISEAAWLAYFVRRGWVVLLPFGTGARYDLAVDRGNGWPERVQIKTARRRDNVLRVPTCSITPDSRQRLSYTPDQIDLLAAYWPVENRYFLIPVAELPTSEIWLRLEPTKNGQREGVRLASEYEV